MPEVGSDKVRVVQRSSAAVNLELRHLKSRLGKKGDEEDRHLVSLLINVAALCNFEHINAVLRDVKNHAVIADTKPKLPLPNIHQPLGKSQRVFLARIKAHLGNKALLDRLGQTL
jgi:hypothetical protein